MIDVWVERSYDSPLSDEAVLQLAEASAGCLSLYRIDWQQSFLAANGQELICHFQAPDLESVRQALRQSGSQFHSAWTGSVHATAAADAVALTPSVLVARRFSEPVAMADLQSREDAHQDCLRLHNVRFVTSFFSRDRLRMLCLYAAPDAEAVRNAQLKAGMPVEAVWSFRHYRAE